MSEPTLRSRRLLALAQVLKGASRSDAAETPAWTGWHDSQDLVMPENIAPIILPP
jgi:hypothetical protein